MKVLWICGLPRGVVREGYGVRSELSWIVGHLPPPQEVELHILCPVFGLERPHRTFCDRGVVWHLVRLRRFEPLSLRLRFAYAARKIVRMIRPDIVHGWGGETGCGLIATYLSRNAVVSVQGLLRMWKGNSLGCRAGAVGFVREYFQRKFEALTYRRAKVLLCEGDASRVLLKELYGHDAIVVPHPLRPEFFGKLGEEEESVLGRQGRKFLFVGQNVARKGIDDLREIQRVHPELDITYVTGGKSASEIARLMRTHDALVLPSYGDTGPTVIKEAIAMGLPVIAYDNTGPKELIEKYGGILVRTGDEESLAKVMMAVSQREMNTDGQRRIRVDLSWRRVWDRLLNVYAEVSK